MNATKHGAEASISTAGAHVDRVQAVERPFVHSDASAEEQYALALHRHLKGMPAKEIDFFVNARRFNMIEVLVGDELRQKGREVLNVACGPFALEFYLQLRDAKITSFDREAKLAGLHAELLASGHLANTEFQIADVHAFATSKQYDAVIINDLFYSKHIDFYALIGRYVSYLKQGGLLYFDIQDERAGPVWRAFGKDGEYRRYNLEDVSKSLAGLGLSVASVTPALGIKGGVDGLLRKGLWWTAGVANSFVFVARKA